MKHSEKKYLVDDLYGVKEKLKQLGAKKSKTIYSVHYYARQPGNDVTKLVHYSDRDEVHILKETGGTYALVEKY